MIFCVEDDSNIRELVIYTLETTGFKARGFEDGKEFLEALALETPELILLDIMLPGMDGLELLSKLKASPKNRDIPVIMLTAKGAESSARPSAATPALAPSASCLRRKFNRHSTKAALPCGEFHGRAAF